MSEVILRESELSNPMGMIGTSSMSGRLPAERLQEFAFYYGTLREMGFDPIKATGALSMSRDNMQEAASFLAGD